MDFTKCCLSFILFHFAFINLCNGLECYVCENQEGNDDKCKETILTCEAGDDMCLTDYRWGSPPYWEPGVRKQYYVSKRCSTKRECELVRKDRSPWCTYVWYLDWKCVDCCSGDRCNYHVILSGSLAKASATVISLSLLAMYAMHRILRI